MKKSFSLLPISLIVLSFTACKECHECHYDKDGTEIELGEYCDDELENIEANGYSASDSTYEVHCHEH